MLTISYVAPIDFKKKVLGFKCLFVNEQLQIHNTTKVVKRVYSNVKLVLPLLLSTPGY